jgi:enamine deaminase RidA (YjgF/YER057c/UK114 family)
MTYKIFTATVVLVAAASLAWAQAPAKEKFHFNKNVEDEYGYAQAVKVGNTIYISGVAGRGPMDQAIDRVYRGLERTLQHYGATFENVVKENLYTTNMEEMIKHQQKRREFYKNDYPAASWVQISRLFVPDAVLEVEIIAVIKE